MKRLIGLTKMEARPITKTEQLNSLQSVNTTRNTEMRQETTSLSVPMITTFKILLLKSSRKKSIQNQMVSRLLMLKSSKPLRFTTKTCSAATKNIRLTTSQRLTRLCCKTWKLSLVSTMETFIQMMVTTWKLSLHITIPLLT